MTGKRHIYWPEDVLQEDDKDQRSIDWTNFDNGQDQGPWAEDTRTEWTPDQITLDDPSASLIIDVYGSADEAFDRALGEGRN